MKKLYAFCLAVFLCLTCVFGLDYFYNIKLYSMKDSLNYEFNIKKQDCIKAVSNSLNQNTILFFGSCELEREDENSHPKVLFNNGNSDFNMMLFGVGYDQSLSHAISVGALADNITNKKVVLNLSPQWFTRENITAENFSSKFYENIFDAFIKNSSISNDTKLKITKRCQELLAAYPEGLNKVNNYDEVYLKSSWNLFDKLYLNISNAFMNLKSKHSLLKDVSLAEGKGNRVIFEQIDFDNLLKASEDQGKMNCTNNPFFISNDYYTSHIKRKIESLKDSQKDDSYSSSLEYDDLKLFLDVCKETGIEPMMISTPINGYWYDYVGWPKEDRLKYYQNIRDISKQYNVELLDLSEHEYTPYFLRDIQNLGWKGWVFVEKGVYEFYKKS